MSMAPGLEHAGFGSEFDTGLLDILDRRHVFSQAESDSVDLFFKFFDTGRRADLFQQFRSRIGELEVDNPKQQELAADGVERSQGNHFAGFNNANPRAEMSRLVQDVARNRDRLAHYSETFQQLADFDAGTGLHTARRFVKQQESGACRNTRASYSRMFHTT